MKLVITIVIFLFSLDLIACSCSRPWNDSFSKTAEESDFVALVKVISFDSYLEDLYPEIGNTERTPYLMTVEIIKKYKGQENRKSIQIYGDNGIFCRPYLTDFKINEYYLISPNLLSSTQYDFFICRTEYLEVDMNSNKAYGKYSMIRYAIDLDTFESKLKNGDNDLLIAGLIGGLLILFSLRIRKK